MTVRWPGLQTGGHTQALIVLKVKFTRRALASQHKRERERVMEELEKLKREKGDEGGTDGGVCVHSLVQAVCRSLAA